MLAHALFETLAMSCLVRRSDSRSEPDFILYHLMKMRKFNIMFMIHETAFTSPFGIACHRLRFYTQSSKNSRGDALDYRLARECHCVFRLDHDQQFLNHHRTLSNVHFHPPTRRTKTSACLISTDGKYTARIAILRSNLEIRGIYYLTDGKLRGQPQVQQEPQIRSHGISSINESTLPVVLELSESGIKLSEQ
jgi:hypothetical protein